MLNKHCKTSVFSQVDNIYRKEGDVMEMKSVLLDDKAIERTLIRISHEIIEKNKEVEDIVLNRR
jgi:hypothetical protein